MKKRSLGTQYFPSAFMNQGKLPVNWTLNPKHIVTGGHLLLIVEHSNGLQNRCWSLSTCPDLSLSASSPISCSPSVSHFPFHLFSHLLFYVQENTPYCFPKGSLRNFHSHSKGNLLEHSDGFINSYV